MIGFKLALAQSGRERLVKRAFSVVPVPKLGQAGELADWGHHRRHDAILEFIALVEEFLEGQIKSLTEGPALSVFIE
jgi:hypothetical protein